MCGALFAVWRLWFINLTFFTEKIFFVLIREYLAAHYSSLFANNDKTTFLWKNLNFAKNGENASTDCSSSAAVFTSNVRIRSKQWKMPLCFVSKTALSSEDSAERRTKNLFAKCQRKRSTHYLIFVGSSIFRGCSQIVYGGLIVYSGPENTTNNIHRRHLTFQNFKSLNI